MIYSLIFPFPLYLIEIKLARSILISTLSFLVKRFSIYSRNSLAVVTFSDTVPLKASRISRFMTIRLMRFERFLLSMSRFSSVKLLSVRSAGHSIFTARSRSMHPKTIITFYFQSFKLVPSSMGDGINISRYSRSKCTS